jgi:hypothetical protein
MFSATNPFGGDAAVGHFFYDHQEPITEKSKATAFREADRPAKLASQTALDHANAL